MSEVKVSEEKLAAPSPVTIVPVAAVLVIAGYIAAQMVADIASLKIGVVAGLAVDMGTFIYPIMPSLNPYQHFVIVLGLSNFLRINENVKMNIPIIRNDKRKLLRDFNSSNKFGSGPLDNLDHSSFCPVMPS